MPKPKSARELLAGSFIFSAKRIMEALDGRLPITNSRKPNAPPSSANEAVGLCGQGGRHLYFRIPIDALKAALSRILRAETLSGPGGLPIEPVLDEITAACQELRQRTYFDDGTGCINDSSPSMVPLLPPEEVWFDGRELPLDVWRLISFEFDLVSSAVAAQVPAEDFALSAVNQSALAFRILVAQLRNQRARFELEFKNMPDNWVPPTGARKAVEVSLARLFMEAGSLLTPLANQDFIKWYAAIRYLHWIDGSKLELRAKKEFRADTLDSRYRGLFAEEMAVGMMAVVLSDHLGARPINNTVEVAAPGSLKPGQLLADFVAQASNPVTGVPTTIIAESKGSLGRSVSKARLDRAKRQVGATKVAYAGYPSTLPATFASSVLFSGQSGNTRCVVADPPLDLGGDSVHVDSLRGWRVAYSKAVKFVGLETAANQVLRGDPAESIRPIDFDREGKKRRSERDLRRERRAAMARELFGMDLLLDAGPCAVGVDRRVATILRHGIPQGHERELSGILRSRRDRLGTEHPGGSFETSLGLGCVFYSDLDEPH